MSDTKIKRLGSLEPDDDGWVKLPNGDRVRRLKAGSMGSEMTFDDDAPQPGRRRIRTINNPFKKYSATNW